MGTAVQRYNEQVSVVTSEEPPQPETSQVVMEIQAAGICNADIRVCTGNKAATAQQEAVTLGHEGVGIVRKIGANVTGIEIGDYAVVLPHHPRVPNAQVDPSLIGNGGTLHMGWDVPGVFADWCTAPATNLIRLSKEHLFTAAEHAPALQANVFAWTEPMMCVLSAYTLMQKQVQQLQRRELSIGKALVIGCGPIGLLHTIALRKLGYEVWFTDTTKKRANLMHWCIRQQGNILDKEVAHPETFDVVIVTPSALGAIKQGERFVRDGGVLYLFAGLNTCDKDATHDSKLFLYEKLHRAAHGLVTTTDQKTVLYVGHSGYYASIALDAVDTVAKYAEELERATTGIIRGWSNSTIESQVSDTPYWTTQDESPAIVSVLTDTTNIREQHCKLLVTK